MIKNIALTLTSFLSFLFFTANSVLAACGAGEVGTGIGCIPVEPPKLVTKLFGIALGIAGGFAFLLLISGALKIIGSHGDPKALDEGKTVITASIFGLIFIVFAVLILRIVGVNILNLPGFGP